MNAALRATGAYNHGEAERPDKVARIEIFDDFAAAESHWRRLESEGALATPYQSFDLMAAWQREVGARTGVTPFLVAGFDASGSPAFLLPLGRSRTGPLGVVGFLGGKHVNFNFGLWRRDVIWNATADDVRAIVAEIGAQPGVDICNFPRQPRSWEGIANPFALLPHQPSPSDSLRLPLNASGEDVIKTTLSPSMRGRLRTKERKLQRLDGYRYLHATAATDVDRLLDAFFPLKAAHMAAQGLSNIFAEPGNEAFLRHCCHQEPAAGKPLIEIHALEAGSEVLALFAGISDGRRFSGMFNTYTMSDNGRQSPGLVLLVHIIGNLADRGLQSFDLGVGEAKYKTFFCKEPELLFDSFLPLTPVGRLAAVAVREGMRMKRQIKQSRALWGFIQKIRRGLGGRVPDDTPGDS